MCQLLPMKWQEGKSCKIFFSLLTLTRVSLNLKHCPPPVVHAVWSNIGILLRYGILLIYEMVAWCNTQPGQNVSRGLKCQIFMPPYYLEQRTIFTSHLKFLVLIASACLQRFEAEPNVSSMLIVNKTLDSYYFYNWISDFCEATVAHFVFLLTS